MAANTTAIQLPASRTAATLQQFTDAALAADGVLLAGLSPIEELEIRTRNTVYRMTVIGGSETRVLIQGGRYFPVQSEVRLNGSTLGGSLLKVGWIGCGFCLEFMHAGQRITTTRVREIHRLPPAISATTH